jgi:hypothetical protein
MMRDRSFRSKLFQLSLAGALLIPGLAAAIQPHNAADTAEDAALKASIFTRELTTPELDVHPSLVILPRGSSKATARFDLETFFAHHSDQWEVRLDTRSNRPNLIEGVGVPLLPGKGNKLTRAAAGLSPRGEIRMAEVESRLRSFMGEFPELFRISQSELRLDPQSSVNVGEDHQIWLMEFQQIHNGVPVEGANVFFRINHGNIVQFGSEKVADVRIDTRPSLNREQAIAAALHAVGFNVSEVSEFVQPGRLEIVPMLTAGERPGEVFRGAAGDGYRHALVWETVFRRVDDPATYRALVNARTGVVMQVSDLNDYAQVTGGIYPQSQLDAETVVGLPSCNVTNGTTKVTDSAGNYTYGGGTATVTLNGKYIKISDNCGTISKSDAVTGNIAFGTSSGTDCTTPGSGGAGNTHSARTGFYHLTNINRKAATFLPTNTWLSGTLTANMNINATCNAFWNGSTVNFYRSGGGCSNTGEIAAVFLHEWGHGMDTNSGGSASDKGTGEAVGDTFAFLETKNGCIGPNFRPGVNCTNCTACTGVRDVADFAVGGSATIAKPANVASDTGINCDRYSCPYLSGGISPYQGPMGYEGHCESYIASSANWDLAQNLISYWGTTTGWSKMDSIWYKSLTPSKSAYQLVSGGKCNPAATVNGCGSTNWYTVYLSVDDDDGNLTNGTPNGCRIWDAFNAHGIACGTRPACTQ